MGEFIAILIITIIMGIVGIAMLIASFTKRASRDESEWTLRWIALVWILMTVTGIFVLIDGFERCPACEVISSENYCHNCGYKLNSTVTCEGCGQTFSSIETAPHYCYECGTLIKEKE